MSVMFSIMYHMQPFFKCYGSSRAADSGSLAIGNSQQELIHSSKVTAQEMLDAKELAASRNHSEAERCRRECINSHLSTICSLLPSSTKTDKASLLAEVIDILSELKQHAADVGDGASMPMDVNELQIDMDPLYGEGWHVLRVTFGCNDSADLFQDLIRIFNQLDFHLLKAEIATLSGQIKCIIHVAARSSSNNKQVMTAATEETNRSSSITALKEALCSFMEEKQVSAAGMSP
ncbi:unnamed protein product [Sphagnum jensenii]|uniref:BHLH domain-containing protein n=2 Tax=Sphagnum jensenii TaxID=128206 RepID=A0ABP1B668_9BRYO